MGDSDWLKNQTRACVSAADWRNIQHGNEKDQSEVRLQQV